jgi:hemerythrin superfamily protein
MNPFDLLKEDHQTILSLSENLRTQLQQSDVDMQQISAEMEKLRHAIEAHSRIEEELFYPTCERVDALRHHIRDAIEAHRALDRELAQLMLTSMETQEQRDAFQQKLAQARHVFDQHRQEEENQLFPEVQNYFSDQELNQLGDELKQRHDREEQRLGSPV